MTRPGPEPRRWRRLRVPMAAVAALVWIALPAVVRAQDAPAFADASVTGIETAEAAPAIAAASRTATGGTNALSVDDRAEGSQDARRDFIAGGIDYVVSGIPFTDGEKTLLNAAGKDVIAAPFQAVGLGLFGFAPGLPVFPPRCIVTDTVDPECTLADSTRYSGPIRLVPDVLADLYFERSNIWTLEQLQSNLVLPPDGSYLFPPINGPRPLVRNDGDASNQFLDRYLALVTPSSRQQVLSGIPGFDPSAPSTENWPNTVTPSRQGQDNVVAQVAEGLDPGASSKSEGGSVTMASPAAIDGAFERNTTKPVGEQVGLFRVQLKNGAGEWVSPTPEAITAALASTGGEPMGGATTNVPGAWPITWVNQLYAPSTGLSAEKANAVATLIRIQVTSGQTSAASLGDGKLPPSLVTQALDAANKIVTSNCAAAKGTVVTVDDLGPFTTSGTKPAGLGQVKLCQGAPAAAPETTGDTTSGASDLAAVSDVPYDSSSSDAGFSPLTDPGTVTDPSAQVLDADAGGGSTGSGSGATGIKETTVAARTAGMPLPLPGLLASPLDTAVTLALGAGAFMLLRRLYQRSKGLL